MLVRLVVVLLILGALCRTLSAHTVPTLVVETEFNSARESVIRVNVDPRLFLTAQPTSLPPVAATWWLELGGEAREKAAAATVTYVENTLDLRIGDVALLGGWKVVAIDSASAFPLSADSVEVHLLAERRQMLPAVPGEFKVSVNNDCSVGVILLNSIEGKPERHPQSLFPGETSRGFKLSAISASSAEEPPVLSVESKQVPEVQQHISLVQLMLVLPLLAAVLLGFLWWRRRV